MRYRTFINKKRKVEEVKGYNYTIFGKESFKRLLMHSIVQDESHAFHTNSQFMQYYRQKVANNSCRRTKILKEYSGADVKCNSNNRLVTPLVVNWEYFTYSRGKVAFIIFPTSNFVPSTIKLAIFLFDPDSALNR